MNVKRLEATENQEQSYKIRLSGSSVAEALGSRSIQEPLYLMRHGTLVAMALTLRVGRKIIETVDPQNFNRPSPADSCRHFELI